MTDKHPYDVDLPRSGKDKLAKFLRALVKLHGHFTDGFTMDDPFNGAPSILFRIFLPEGTEDAFEKSTGLKLQIPAKYGVNPVVPPPPPATPPPPPELPKILPPSVTVIPNSAGKIKPLSPDQMKALLLPTNFSPETLPGPQTYLVEDLYYFARLNKIDLNEVFNRARRVMRDFVTLGPKETVYMEPRDLLSVLLGCMMAMKALSQEQEVIAADGEEDMGPCMEPDCPDCNPFAGLIPDLKSDNQFADLDIPDFEIKLEEEEEGQ